MALTVATTNRNAQAVSLGNLRARLVTVTFDSSYPTGGEAFAPADVGLSEFAFVGVSIDGAPGYVVAFDYGTNKLMVFGVEQDADAAVTDPLDEENATADLSTLVIRVLCIGY